MPWRKHKQPELQGGAPLEYALQVAGESGLPLMAHIDEPPPSYEEVIARLRPGDVLTHAFRPFPNAPCTVQGTIKPEVLRARERGLIHARSHIERLIADLPSNCGLVTVLDGHPATLAWLGAVNGHRVRPLGVEHFGQTGSIPDLYRHYGIDANAIVAAAQAIAPGRPIRHLRALG